MERNLSPQSRALMARRARAKEQAARRTLAVRRAALWAAVFAVGVYASTAGLRHALVREDARIDRVAEIHRPVACDVALQSATATLQERLACMATMSPQQRADARLPTLGN